MNPPAVSSAPRWKKVITSAPFWIIVMSLVVITMLHYTPQIRPFPLAVDVFLSRHTVERILFILPVAGATIVYGRRGGLIILALAILVMLPRAALLSPSPVDALVETTIIAVTGYCVAWMVEYQVREKALHQKTASQLRAINTVTAIVTGSLELDQILNDALDKALEVMGLEAGLIFFLDQQTRELILVAYRGMSQESVAELDRLKLGEGFCGRVARSGELMVIPDSSQDPRLTRLAVRREGLRGQIIVPLRSKGQVQGVLAMATRHLRQFLPGELGLVTAIGDQIGVAIENSQLHRDIARQLRIQQQLSEVVERITSELELDRILPKVLQIAEELVGADGGGIALFDQKRENIRYRYLHNLPQELADVPVSEREGIVGEVMVTGRPVVTENYRSYPSFIPAFAQEGITSVVAVPIVTGDRSFGALTLISTEQTKHFSGRDIAILSGIGRQTGIAIENARLYGNLRFYIQKITEAQENERKRIARDLHDETVQMLIVISRRLEILATLPEQLPESATPHLESLQELIGDTLKEIRRFVHDLRPPTLDHLGLVATLEGLVSSLREDGIEAELGVTGEARRLTPEEELMLFRIVQEALHNVRRHSRASRVTMQIEFHPNQARISIEDNGDGFDAPERVGDLVSSGKLGLIGMYERARTLGGTLMIRSEPGQGTEVIVDVPLQPEPQDRTGDS
ncbi:MAG: GAF domain-containing sensor histidine kinase [Chloroflexota bacterium]|nr:GAF domain-containing sensor histidine kinase [Chloroflexota bacterium]